MKKNVMLIVHGFEIPIERWQKVSNKTNGKTVSIGPLSALMKMRKIWLIVSKKHTGISDEMF